MCPIETPEGPNIGLITSLSTYARINDLGFIETPYRVVKNGKVTDEIRWLSASEEEGYAVAQANAPLDEDGTFAEQLVLCRKRDDYPLLPPDRIDFMDVAPEQLVSIAAALIPFLEHDDANRALMGSNMQRQAVPLLFPQAPLVGTGLEEKVARDSGAVIIARRAGIVTRVTADEIIVDTGDGRRASGRPPLARLAQHDRYRVQEVLAHQPGHRHQPAAAGAAGPEGRGRARSSPTAPATEDGELALGSNVLVAFMPWYGHNFEDAIVLSRAAGEGRRLLVDPHPGARAARPRHQARPGRDHARDPERRRGGAGRPRRARHRPHRRPREAGRHPGRQDHAQGRDRAFAGREAADGDLRREGQGREGLLAQGAAGHGGVVIDVKIFSRIEDQVVEKDRGERIGEVRRIENEEKSAHPEACWTSCSDLLAGPGSGADAQGGHGGGVPAGGHQAHAAAARRASTSPRSTSRRCGWPTRPPTSGSAPPSTPPTRERAKVEEKAEDQIDKILQPDELPPGVIQLVKVYIAEKRKISVGDKMAGRHGNKGIIARIVPEEDMPFLPDGTPVDIVLNPLGVPSRMNVGQILETHLGGRAASSASRRRRRCSRAPTRTRSACCCGWPGCSWAREALGSASRRRHRRSRDDHAGMVARPEDGGRASADARSSAGIGMLGAQGVSAETRELYQASRDFLTRAAKELAERELAQRRQEVAYHKRQAEDDAKADRRRLAQGAREVGARRRPRRWRRRRTRRWPALLGRKSERGRRRGGRRAAPGWRDSRPAGKVRLRDGRTGQPFDGDVTVGAIYMLKLSHLVDDKIHARSIGPYSLVTQQPLAGKAQFGGQRFGEMEVWALEAYGAAHTLQEMLTVKSDDVNGRSRVYEAIVKGQNLPEPGIPESFNVLVKELQALGLKVTLGTTESRR